MPVEGVEPTLPLRGKRILNPSEHSDKGIVNGDLGDIGPQCAAQTHSAPPQNGEGAPPLVSPSDPDLRGLVTAWPSLLPAIRAAIIALVNASTSR